MIYYGDRLVWRHTSHYYGTVIAAGHGMALRLRDDRRSWVSRRSWFRRWAALVYHLGPDGALRVEGPER